MSLMSAVIEKIIYFRYICSSIYYNYVIILWTDDHMCVLYVSSAF